MMNRILYITLAAVALLLSACSERPLDPTPNVPGSSNSYIFFEAEVVDCIETKTSMLEGTALPSEAGTAFGVFGHAENTELFNNTEVYRRDDGLFTYDNLVKWVDGKTIHNFYAYYPYDLKDSYTISVGTDKIPYIEYVQPEDQEDMIDILTAAYGNTKQSYVELDFKHRLWALDITIENARVKNDSLFVSYDDKTDESHYEVFPPVMKVKSMTVEIDEMPQTGNIYMDGRVSTSTTHSLTKTYSNITLASGASEVLNGENSFLFLPCTSFKYRITIEFVNENLGLTYTSHHPSTYKLDEEGNPDLLNGEFQWDWAVAKGPDANNDGEGDGLIGGNRYKLDIVKSDYKVEFIWKQSDWGRWNGTEWESVDVPHLFS